MAAATLDQIASATERSMGMFAIVPMLQVTGTTMRIVEKSFNASLPKTKKKRRRKR